MVGVVCVYGWDGMDEGKKGGRKEGRKEGDGIRWYFDASKQARRIYVCVCGAALVEGVPW